MKFVKKSRSRGIGQFAAAAFLLAASYSFGATFEITGIPESEVLVVSQSGTASAAVIPEIGEKCISAVLNVEYDTDALTFDSGEIVNKASGAGLKGVEEDTPGKVQVYFTFVDGSGIEGSDPVEDYTFAELTFTANEVGTHSLTISDDSSASFTNGTLDLENSEDGEVVAFGVDPVVADAAVDLPEDAADGTDVHAVEATDAQDDIKETGGYAITAGDADGAFAIDDAGQITVADSAQLDFETTATYNLTVEVTDDEGNTGEGTVTVNLTDVNESPTAVADSANATEDGAPVDIDVLANDTDPDAGDTKKVVSVNTDETVGTVMIDGDGVDNQVNYDVGTAFQDLAAGETTTDTFDYTMEDSEGLQGSATVTVTITGVNDAPIAQDAGAADDRILVINGQADNSVDLTNYADDIDSDDSPADLVYAIVDDAALPAGITASITDEIITFDASAHDAEVEFEITFNATDSHDATSATKSIYLSAINNQPPAITEVTPAQDPTIDEGDSQEFAITASDAGNQPQDDGIAGIVWYLNINGQGFDQVQDEGVSSDEGAVSDSYTFDTDQDTQLHDGSNTFVVRAEATDGEGVTNRQEWTVTVNDVNNPPSIDSVTVQAVDADDEEVSPSKPIDVTKLVGTASISDLDAEDFENGLPVGDDEVEFTWMLTRKGFNNDEPFQVASTTITAAAVPDPFEVVLDEAALNAELANQGADQNGFQKDDQFVLLVTADDGAVDNPVEAQEKMTLGNPGWFPAISWTDVPDVDDYKVEVFAGDMAGAASRGGHETAIVTMYTSDPQVNVADYFAGKWDNEYLADRPTGVDRVFGLRPGNYEVKIYRYGEAAARNETSWTELETQTLSVDEYDAPAAAKVADEDQTDKEDLAPLVGTFELTSAAGCIVDVALVGEDGEETAKPELGFRKLLRPDSDGVLSTDAEVEVRLNAPVGTYNVYVTAFNPDAVAEQSAEGGVVIQERDTVLPSEDEDQPAELTPDQWGMSPGTGDPDNPEYVGKGTVDVEFSWNPIQGADHYRIVVFDAAGDTPAGLGNVRVNGTSITREIAGQYSGRYAWHVLAVGANGETKWSNSDPDPNRDRDRPHYFAIEPAAEADVDYNELVVGDNDPTADDIVTWTLPAAQDTVHVYVYDMTAAKPEDAFLRDGLEVAVNGALTLDVVGNSGHVNLGLSAPYDLLIGVSLDGRFWRYWSLTPAAMNEVQ